MLTLVSLIQCTLACKADSQDLAWQVEAILLAGYTLLKMWEIIADCEALAQKT